MNSYLKKQMSSLIVTTLKTYKHKLLKYNKNEPERL